MTLIEKLARKFVAVQPALTERGRRLWAGSEADMLGRGGIAWVAKATGLAISTVRKGRDEVRSSERPVLVRDRRPGGGRPRLEEEEPRLMEVLESLVSPSTRGDPESPLRWTCKSVRVLARELERRSHPISPSKVGQLLRQSGYSLQANAKTKEGSSHPDRDSQFSFINAKAEDFIARGLPVISVDSKKKELVGEHANRGQEWQPKGRAIEVLSHDFVDPASQRAIPYGVYDVAKNIGFVNVGTDHNTPTFAVRSIEKWWEQMGCARYPGAKELFITADAGGSNSSRARLWKLKLQEVADRTGVTIHVSHFPPGTSKWNKIEHRLFSFISINWRGFPLTTYETIVQLIAATTTSKGLTVKAELDLDKYPLRVSITNEALGKLQLGRASFHGEWNYTLSPRSAEQLEIASQTKQVIKRIGTRAETRQRWLKIFDQQRVSGMGHTEFCSATGINYTSYINSRAKVFGRIWPRTESGRISNERKEKWLRLLREHEASGLTQAEFCRERGIVPGSLSVMRKRLTGVILRRRGGAK
jgi:transposase